jgi:predicted RNA-binding Zn-ribbon protein involved in translation (DUF1610 family)
VSQRFVDAPYYLTDFVQDVLVVCPQCGSLAQIRCSVPYWSGTATVACRTCGFSEKSDEAGWAGPAWGLARRRCGRCGRWLTRRWTRRSGPGGDTADLTCPGCGAVSRAKVVWHRGNPVGPHDPVFGLPLFLQVPACGETLWAVSQAHLDFLRAYVQADLRERTPNWNGSLASRLPTWIKTRKNRDAVLRAVKRLEDRIGRGLRRGRD